MTRNYARGIAATLAAEVKNAVSILTLVGSVLIFLAVKDAKEAFGIVAAFVIIMADIPYFISIFKGKTTPNRTSWWIWFVLSILIVQSSNEAHDGANNTIWVPVAYMIDQGLVALISLSPKYGEGGKNKFDFFCIIGALIGIVLWWTMGATWGLLAFIFSDLTGALPTVKKSFVRPEGEDSLAWSMIVVGNAINFFAAEKLAVEFLAYPIYATVTSAIILFPLLRNRFRNQNPH